MRKRGWAGALVLTGAGLVGYGVAEAKRYGLKDHLIPVLPEGAKPLRMLVISDFHLRPANRRLRRFLESLSKQDFDVVIAAGDFLGGPQSIGDCVRLLNGLRASCGRYFVLGSSDYFSPTFKTYAEYFLKIKRHGTERTPVQNLRDGLTSQGWEDMTNRNIVAEWRGTPTQITGLDDPYLGWEDRSLLVRGSEASFAVCVVHDPAPCFDAIGAGYDLVISGHTHGGQVRLPFIGAVVTNSSLPTKFAKGLSRINEGWLFVTPGLGVGKFAPFRFMCPPEASVLHLVPVQGDSDEEDGAQTRADPSAPGG